MLLIPHVEVLNIDVFVGGGLSLAPEQETLLGRGFLDGDVLDGESEDDGPDHSQGHLHVAVDDFLCADGDETNALGLDEVERLVHVGDFVETHLSAVWPGEALSRDHLEQQHQFQAVAEVDVDRLNRSARLAQVRVAPGGERLNQSQSTLISSRTEHSSEDQCVGKLTPYNVTYVLFVLRSRVNLVQCWYLRRLYLLGEKAFLRGPEDKAYNMCCTLDDNTPPFKPTVNRPERPYLL